MLAMVNDTLLSYYVDNVTRRRSMSEHIVRDVDTKMVELANGKGAFVFDIILIKHPKSPELNDYLIRVRSMEDDFIVVDWTEFESKDPVFDFADHLEKIL